MSNNISITKELLDANYCHERVDNAPRDPETTAFKREARLRQSLWRQNLGLPIGSHPMRPKDGKEPRKLGSRIDLQYALETGANFLTEAALKAVQHRISNPEPKQTFYLDRLYADLLSSMPMCFNLFGPLFGNREYATKAAQSWWPDIPGTVNDVRFEWSPGRQVAGRFLENRSAFDVAFEIGQPNGDVGIVGVETKYHENCQPEKCPSEKRMKRYKQVTSESGVFRPGAIEAIVGTKLQQIWLDHLLVLSMLQDSSGKWTWAKFVLVHPSRNPSYAKAVEDYFDLLKDSSTIEVRTIESLFEYGVFHEEETIAFRERYLW